MHGGGGVGGDKAGDTCLLPGSGKPRLPRRVGELHARGRRGTIQSRAFPRRSRTRRPPSHGFAPIPNLGLPTCIIAVGNSAGGTLAALLATTDNDDVQQLEPAANTTYGNTEDFHVDGLVTFAGTMDFVAAGCTGYQILDQFGNRIPCQGGISCGTDPDWVLIPATVATTDATVSPATLGASHGVPGYGTTAAEVFLGVQWPAQPTICPPSDPHRRQTLGPATHSSTLRPSTGRIPTTRPTSAFPRSWTPSRRAFKQGYWSTHISGFKAGRPCIQDPRAGLRSRHGIALRALHVVQVSGACAAWEPLSACGNGCNSSAGRAANQTHLAINGLGSCPRWAGRGGRRHARAPRAGGRRRARSVAKPWPASSASIDVR